VRKARRAGTLYGGESPGYRAFETLGFRDSLIVRSMDWKNERGLNERDACSGGLVEGEPERSKGPGEHMVPP
jgi:hypothetical protein